MKFDFNKQFETMMQEKQLENVVILGHVNPDGDAAGSVMGLAHYIHAVYPQYKVYPFLAENLNKGSKMKVAEDVFFHPFMEPKVEKYAVIVCDTSKRARIIGLEYYENADATMVIDHHQANEGYGDINYTEISESCSENIWYTLDWKRWKENKREMESHPNAGDYIYMGIVSDTAGFTRETEHTMNAVTQLLKMGVDHQYAMKTMKIQTLSDLLKQSQLLEMAKCEMDGKVAYVIVSEEKKYKYNIGIEDIHPISGILKDCTDIQLGFTMFEEEKGRWRCSFRSDGEWINVNYLLASFGGGGHAGAAGVTLNNVELDIFLKELFDLIPKFIVQN